MSRQTAALRAAAKQQVYRPDFLTVLHIPTGDVHHFPPAHLNITRLVLCSNYGLASGCAMGARCKFVHASTDNATEQPVHVNYAWRTADLVTYERFPAGETFEVAPPNSQTVNEVLASELALKTKALESTRRPLSHCAHYYFNRTCTLGPDCQFIHAVCIDEAAADFQRAPKPSRHYESKEGLQAAGQPQQQPPAQAQPPQAQVQSEKAVEISTQTMEDARPARNAPVMMAQREQQPVLPTPASHGDTQAPPLAASPQAHYPYGNGGRYLSAQAPPPPSTHAPRFH